MSLLERQRIRLQTDPTSHTAAKEKLTNALPKIWRGNDVQVEVGIFKDASTFVTDVSNIDALVLEIHDNNNRQGAPLYQDTLATVDLVTITEANWTNGSAEHAVFEIAAADTNFALGDATQNTKQFWLVIHAELTTGEMVTLIATTLEVEEDAAQNGLPVVGSSNPGFRVTSDGRLQIKNTTTGKWHEIGLTGAATAPQIVFGPEET